MWAACRAKQFGASVLLEGSRIFTEFKGALTEQYVLQQLIATQENPVFYWATEKALQRSILLYKAKACTA